MAYVGIDLHKRESQICILAGGITSFSLGLSSAGGASIGLGWPISCLFSLLCAMAMGQIALKNNDEALKEIQATLKLSPQHERAKMAMEQLATAQQ